MGYSAKTISAARTRLAELSDEKDRQNQLRLQQVYKRLPQVRDIDHELRSMMAELVVATFQSGTDPTEAIKEMKARNLALQSQREDLLAREGFPPDYTDHKFYCEKCSDRGYIGTKMCSCLQELCSRQQKKELSALLKLGSDSFDDFRLDYYSSAVDQSYGVSPRDNMELIFENCVEYARRFGPDSGNLCFRGSTGLGKTFLSACIAREVSDRGFSVVYDTAIDMFDVFERVKFGDQTPEEDPTRKYMSCDLLIVDDLGTEMKTQFTVSALYSVVNTRLMKGKKTIITTNLSTSAMKERYTPQIMSRLEGEYTAFYFFGEDIRLKKRGF